jgi:hypothetical protein
MALAVALFAVVVVGALIAGSFFVGTQEQRMAENSYSAQAMFARAEGLASNEFRVWDPKRYNVLSQYPQAPATFDSGSAGGTIRKLNANTYMVDVTASEPIAGTRGRGARQRVLLLGRIKLLQLPTQASLTTQGNVNLVGTSSVDGTDHIPNASWTTCDPPDTTKAGIRVPPASNVTASGAAEVDGEPPVLKDPTLTADTFTVFGDVTYDDLAARATIVLGGGQTLRTEPVVTNGVCNTTYVTNWGDGQNRGSPCGSYFPIVHIQGNVILNNVQGQGILLVDGDVDVQGSYEFFGVVIVRGRLKTAGGGSTAAHFWGMVMAQNVDFDSQLIGGHANLNYSRCAIIQTLEMTGMAAMLRSRGFVQLS